MKPRVALVGWHWTGHHPTFFVQCAEALAACGCEVYGLCPDPEDAAQLLESRGLAREGSVHVGYCSKWRRPNGTGKFGWRRVVAGAQNLLSMRHALRAMEKERGAKADLVFFNSIHDADFVGVRPLRALLPRRWAGLYLHSFAFRTTVSPMYEGIRESARANRLLPNGRPVAVATLDEEVLGQIEAVTGRRNAVLFPDIADETAPDAGPDSLGERIRALARGRPVITLAGSLHHQRGIGAFLEAALANPQWFFVLAGTLPPEVRMDYAQELAAFGARCPENGFFHDGFIRGEAAFNGLIAASDVVWNLHIDWPGSSNSLSKAAVFQRPVIVGRGHLLEQRVRKFRLGEVCDENDAASVSAALKSILTDTHGWQESNRPAWSEYRKIHSKDRLDEAMREVLVLAGLAGETAGTMSAREPAPTVAHVDWSWTGHHPTYFTHHAAALAKIGCQVVPFCANPAEFKARLDGLQLPESVVGRVATAQKQDAPSFPRIRPARWRGRLEALTFFSALGRRLRRWEKENGQKIDFVFFGGVYDKQFRNFALSERFFGYPCGGMYIQGRYFHMPGSPIPYGNGLPCPDKIFAARGFRGIGVLDPAVVEPLRRLSGGKRVVVFPDVTHERRTPDNHKAWELVRKIRSFASGRRIVALAGHLQWTKGFEDLTKAARHPALQDFVFVLAGGLNWSEVSEEKGRHLLSEWQNNPNIFTHLHSLPEESMNAVLSSADVIWAAYRSFPNNSNILTKAALLEKPVLVSDGYLMGRLAKEYGLGEVVPEGDLDAIVAALRRMVAPDYSESLRRRARWREYHALHAADRLPGCFRELLGMAAE
jgi:glycosyltransferase involved in cell wall biosynthesis